MKLIKVLRQWNRKRVVSSINQYDEKITYRKITSHVSDKELILKIHKKIPQLKCKTNTILKRVNKGVEECAKI